MMIMRPYQEQAVAAIENEWLRGVKKTLLVMPTGSGKTIVFAKIAENRVRKGERVLILAHREELLDQARKKMRASTGLACATEKAGETCIGAWERVTVGSVQTLAREKRLSALPPDYFDTIAIDEAHHCLADSYQRVIAHFPDAKLLGVTATPDRGDRKNLGRIFETLAYEYTLPRAISRANLPPASTCMAISSPAERSWSDGLPSTASIYRRGRSQKAPTRLIG